MRENGHNPPAFAKRIRYVPESGVPLLVEPLSPYTMKAISQKAWEVYPNPPEEDYRLPFPESAIPDDYKPAKDNPEWVRLVEQATVQRTNWIIEKTILLAAQPDDLTEADLVDRFHARRKQLAMVIDLPVDDWEATLIHCICVGRQDPNNIWEIARGTAELTEEEVAEGFRFFRMVVSGQAARRLDRETPGLPRGAESQP